MIHIGFDAVPGEFRVIPGSQKDLWSFRVLVILYTVRFSSFQTMMSLSLPETLITIFLQSFKKHF